MNHPKRKRQESWNKTDYTSQGIYPNGGLNTGSTKSQKNKKYHYYSSYRINLKLKLNEEHQIVTLNGKWEKYDESRTTEINKVESMSIFISSLNFNKQYQRMEFNCIKYPEQKSSEIVDFKEEKFEEKIFKFYVFKDSDDVINVFWRGLTSNQEPFLVRGRVIALENCCFPFKPGDTFQVIADKAVYSLV